MTPKGRRAKSGAMLTKDPEEARDERSDAPSFDIEEDGDRVSCRLAGRWTTQAVAGVEPSVGGLEAREGIAQLDLDLSGFTLLRADAYAGSQSAAQFICRMRRVHVRVRGAPCRQTDIARQILGALFDVDSTGAIPAGTAQD